MPRSLRSVLLLVAVIALVFTALALVSPSRASVLAEVDKATQTMRVTAGDTVYVWPVSTAGRGAVTPTGTFRPYWLSKHHRSRKYRWAPMPNAVFYEGDYAIHGTLDEHLIGKPASRGCVRLKVAHSKIFYDLVERYGKHNVRIVIA